jgi:hypothetical protein
MLMRHCRCDAPRHSRRGSKRCHARRHADVASRYAADTLPRTSALPPPLPTFCAATPRAALTRLPPRERAIDSSRLRASAQRAKKWRGVLPDAVTPCHTPLPIFMPLIIFHYFASHFHCHILMILHCRIFISLLHTPASRHIFSGARLSFFG